MRLGLRRPHRVIQQSLVAEYRFDKKNLLLWSEQLDNAVWEKRNSSIIANQTTAPDGTNTADKLIENGALTYHDITQDSYSPVIGIEYTLSAYLKAAERTWVSFGGLGLYGANENIQFDLINGVAYNTGTGNARCFIVDVGNGWYRCAATFTATTTGEFTIQLRNGYDADNPAAATGNTYQGNGVSGIYIWGAQLELGPAASTYQKTTDGQTLWNSKESWMYPTNIITNGNFASDLTGWTFIAGSTGTAEYSAGTLKLTAVAQKPKEQQAVSVVAGRKYYLKAKRFLESGTIGNSGVFLASVDALTGYYTVPETNSTTGIWVNHSGVYTATVTRTEYIQCGRNVDLTYVAYYDDVMMIDLTVLFGAGNEPTAEQCNNMFPSRFDGTIGMNVPQYNGTLGSTASSDANDPTAMGQGLSFVTDDYVGEVGGISDFSFIQNTGRFTIIVCASLDAHDADKLQTFLGNTGTTADKGFYLAWDNRTGLGTKQLRMSVNRGTGGSSVISSVSPENVVLDNSPHLFAFKGNGTNINYVVDRTNFAGTSSMGTFSSGDSTRSVNVGRYNGAVPGSYLDGKMYYLLIYNRELTNIEISRIYNYLNPLLAGRGVLLAA